MRSAVFLSVTFLLAACSQAPHTDRAGLAATTAAWQKGFDSGDAAAIAGLYAQDAVLLPPNSEPIAGRSGIEAFMTGLITTGLNGSLEDVDIYANGDLGAKVGRFTLTDDDGNIVDHGKYMEIWHNIDGKWLMVRDIYNSSVPLPAVPDSGADESSGQSTE